MNKEKMMIKGRSYTTSTVHIAVPVTVRTRDGEVTVHRQACGIASTQVAYIYQVEEGTPVTCKRCAGLSDERVAEIYLAAR